MDKVYHRRQRNRVFITLLAGMALFIFSNGRWTIPVAAWLAPVFLIYSLRRTKPAQGLLALFLCIAIATHLMLHEIVPSHLGVLTYILIIYYALLWWIPYLADRLLVRSFKGLFVGTLIFPVTAVTFEYLNMVFFGSWAATAYSQAGQLPLLQIMSVTGMWGVSFLVLWFGPVINWCFEHDWQWQRVRTGLLTFVGILGFVLLFGGLRLALANDEIPSAHVASFTAIEPAEQYADALSDLGYTSTVELARNDRTSLRNLLSVRNDDMLEHSRNITRSGASIVIWAEGATTVPEEDEQDFIASGQQVARSTGTYQLLAYLMLPGTDPGNNAENKCVLIDPAGGIQWTYLKTYPVPGVTNKPGDGIVPLVESPHGKLASVICYDMDFTNLVRQAGLNEADIMLVPAWDWKAIDPLHAEMAVFRSIENGFSMVRQTGEGLSVAVDAYGRVLSAMDYFDPGDQVMHAQVPTRGTWTVYAQIGDVFAWLSAMGLILFMIQGIRRHLARHRG